MVGDPSLTRRVGIGVEEADGDRLGAGGGDLAGEPIELVVVGGGEDAAFGSRPLVDLERELSRDRWQRVASPADSCAISSKSSV